MHGALPDAESEPLALDASAIRARLSRPELAPLIETSVDSTNLCLAERRGRGERLQVLLAEQQTAGRGRQGRQWLSPPRRGLYLSMAREFSRPARDLGALALIAGLAAAAALAQHSKLRIGLKWPNDLQVDGRKLGGCLIDLSTAGQSRSLAIIGIGINVDLGQSSGPDQPWTDLVRAGGSSDRSALAVALIEALDDHLRRFESSGFEPFRADWEAHDVLRGRPLQISGSPAVHGLGLGVDAHGALLVETQQGRKTIHAGEVSVRPLEQPR